MDEAAVQNIVQQSNNALMARPSWLALTFPAWKDQAKRLLRSNLKIKKLKTSETHSFKKKSNEEQFKATKNVSNIIEDATFYLEKRDLDKTKESLDKGKALLKER